MKTNVQSLTGHSQVGFSAWLSESNSFLSELLQCRISNLSFLGVLAFAFCALATIILASDAVQEYGWAAFSALLAFNSVLSLFHEFSEGGSSK